MRIFRTCLLICFAAASPVVVAAQAPVPAQAQTTAVLAEIHATGTSHYSDAQVAAAAGLHIGDTVTRDDLQAAADRLAQLGVFSKVSYRFTPRKDGRNEIDVEFQLTDNADVVPVTFDNFPWFSDEELSAAIRTAIPFFNGFAPPDGAVLDTINATISKLLQDRHISGDLEHTLLARPDSNAMTLQFRLNGPSLKIGSIEYGDSLAAASTELEERKNDILNKPYSRFSIELFELEQIRPLYLTTGHLKVNFGAPVARFASGAGDPGQPPLSNLSVQIPIDPGPVFHLSALNWDGNHALDSKALSELSTVPIGELADGMKLIALWQSVEAAYGHIGYIHAHAEPQPQFDDAAATVSYRISIDEGAQYHMGTLVLTGLSAAGEAALRAAWKLPTGKVFDAAYADAMFTKLEQPSSEIFGFLPIHYTMEGHLLRVDEKNHAVDVLIDFQ